MLNYLKREYFFSFSFEIYFGTVQNQERVGFINDFWRNPGNVLLLKEFYLVSFSVLRYDMPKIWKQKFSKLNSCSLYCSFIFSLG